MAMLDHTLREIRERNADHFKIAGPLSGNQAQQDIRALLAYMDELIEELDRWEADDE